MSEFPTVRLKYVLQERDERLGEGVAELLALSKAKGVVPRDSMDQAAAEATSLAKYKRVSPGDLVMNKMQAWNGVFALSEREGVTSPDYTVLTPTSARLDARFMIYALRTEAFASKCFRVARGMGSAYLRVNTADLLALEIPSPPLEVQHEIVDYLDAAVGDIGSLQEMLGISTMRGAAPGSLIQLLSEYRESVIHELVFGICPVPEGLQTA